MFVNCSVSSYLNSDDTGEVVADVKQKWHIKRPSYLQDDGVVQSNQSGGEPALTASVGEWLET